MAKSNITTGASLIGRIEKISSSGNLGGSSEFVVTGATVKCKEGEREAHLIKTSFGNLNMGAALGLTKDDKAIAESDFGTCKKLTEKHKKATGKKRKSNVSRTLQNG